VVDSWYESVALFSHIIEIGYFVHCGLTQVGLASALAIPSVELSLISAWGIAKVKIPRWDECFIVDRIRVRSKGLIE